MSTSSAGEKSAARGKINPRQLNVSSDGRTKRKRESEKREIADKNDDDDARCQNNNNIIIIIRLLLVALGTAAHTYAYIDREETR